MSTKLKATISGHRSAFTKLLKNIEDGKSNEEFDRNELGTILDLILKKQELFSFTIMWKANTTVRVSRREYRRQSL
jgi:hypothetical protein